MEYIYRHYNRKIKCLNKEQFDRWRSFLVFQCVLNTLLPLFWVKEFSKNFHVIYTNLHLNIFPQILKEIYLFFFFFTSDFFFYIVFNFLEKLIRKMSEDVTIILIWFINSIQKMKISRIFFFVSKDAQRPLRSLWLLWVLYPSN